MMLSIVEQKEETCDDDRGGISDLICICQQCENTFENVNSTLRR